MTRKLAVISAVNLVEGGPLTILRDCVASAVQSLGDEWIIFVLVHRKNLISCAEVKCFALPDAKRSWFHRLWFEWYVFSRFSQRIQPHLWLSLHDITPRVSAKRQVVYCHNAAPFYKLRFRDLFFDPKFSLFCLFYKNLYKAFISKNKFAVVQQEWIRQKFINLSPQQKIIVACPSLEVFMDGSAPKPASDITSSKPKKLVILFPSFPRVFKNFEVLCDAVSLLPPHLKEIVELRLTISGKENLYSRYIYNKYSSERGIQFIGRLSKAELISEYENCDAVVFPSKLETWGLPITEAKLFDKALIVADLPYAHETVGDYSKVIFLSPDCAREWCDVFIKIATNQYAFNEHVSVNPPEPYARNWSELWHMISDGL